MTRLPTQSHQNLREPDDIGESDSEGLAEQQGLSIGNPQATVIGFRRLASAEVLRSSTQGKTSLLRLDIISGIVLGCGVIRARSKAGAARRYGSHESISHADRGSNGHRY